LTIVQGGDGTVYGQVYEGGLTDVAPNIVGQAPGITAWVGISPVGSNTNPNTWTNWVPATWNSGHVSNNDEYQATIGATLAPGTYYYATRFRLNSGAYVYGGIDSSNNGNFWNGTVYNSGVLTVTPPPAPANDNCPSPVALTAGGVFGDNDIDSTNFGATLSTETPDPTCGGFSAAKDVWYSVVVPASGSLTIETGVTSTGGTGIDTVIAAYTGSCGTPLTQIGCDDSGAAESTYDLSKLSLTGQTPGATILVRVYGWNGVQGAYSISAYDASLANDSFDNANFTFYPNPVRDVLNLSYSENITKVQVINLLGQEVKTNSVNATQAQVDMSNLPTGTYLVKVTANDKVKTIKVIKQ
jgi:Secretion system C-terminal sorting domain